MEKIGRNAPCPCGSGKKYKKCCLLKQAAQKPPSDSPIKYTPVYTDLDQLSNSVVNLIDQNKLDEAETASSKLLDEYPDQIDGLERLGQVYEARGQKDKAAVFYQKAADFAESMPGFDQQSIDWYLAQVRRMKAGTKKGCGGEKKNTN